MKDIGYIYLTTNLINGKMYVGQHLATEFDTKYKGSGHYIKRAFDKYGWDNFDCKIICWCSTQTQLNETEDNYIKLLGTMSPQGYNLKGGGSHGKFSKEARKNVSEAHIKYYESEDGKKTAKKHSETMKKYYESEEGLKARKKHSNLLKGKQHNEVENKKRSDTLKKYYESEENRVKLSKSLKGKPKSEEARKNMSKAQKGKPKSEEALKKLLEANKKYWENEEARKNMSDTKKKYYESEEGIKARKKHSEALKKYWESEETRKKQSEAQDKYKKKVYQYTLDGEFVKEWTSLSEIKRVLGYDISSISRCCNGKHKQAYVFLWRFAD